MAAAVAPVNVSAGAVRLRIGLFHLATTRMTPKNETTFATKAIATPAAAITAPATAGPTALARLNSIPFRAELNLARAVGPAVAGAVIAAAGVAMAFVAN